MNSQTTRHTHTLDLARASVWAVAACLVVASLTPLTAAAQGMPDEVVAFFQELSTIAEKNKTNCTQMGAELNSYLDQKVKVLDDAAYSTEEATKAQEGEILAAAKSLGEGAGACFDNEEVSRFLQRLTQKATEVGGP
jgi:hypothetical protein